MSSLPTIPFLAADRVFVFLLVSMAFVAIWRGDGMPVRAAEPDSPQLEPLFEAIAAGRADVRLIPADASRGQLLLKNRTDRPIALAIPDSFAALPEHHPLLAQFGNQAAGNLFPAQNQGNQIGLGNNLLLGNGPPGGVTQGLGGGNPFGQQNIGPPIGNQPFGGQNAGPQFGNPLFRIPPQGVRKVTVSTVCLEYGKPEPNPRVVYRLVPLEKIGGDQRLAAVCRLVATQQIDQKVGQAITWHFTNDLSWDELGEIKARVSRYTGSVPMFREEQIEQAKAVANRLKATQEQAPENRYSGTAAAELVSRSR